MKYAEYRPSPCLAPLVERFWLLEGAAAGAADAIIPDGRVELIFHYGAPFWRHWNRHPRSCWQTGSPRHAWISLPHWVPTHWAHETPCGPQTPPLH